MANLTGKQIAFIDAYLGDANFNATEAARAAGYSGNGITLAAVGYENLNKPHINNEISRRLQARAMSADEALARLADQARGDHTNYISSDGVIDLGGLIADGKAHLIKGIKETKYGQQIEFYDSQSALALIAKHHGLLVNKVDQTNTNYDINMSELSDDQLKRLANGESILDVMSE